MSVVLCEQLKQASSDLERERLLTEAASTPECLELLLERARQTVNAAPDEGLEWSALAIEVASRRNDPATLAAARRAQGQSFRALGRHAEAVATFKVASEAAQQAGNPRLAAQVQLGSIDSLGMMARYDEAFALAKRLENELRAAGAEEDAAKALVNAGNLHFRRDAFAQALTCYQEAGTILSRSADPTVSALLWVNCANILTQLHRMEEAIDLYRQARPIFMERGKTAEAATIDLNVGFLHYVSGRYAAALATLSQAFQEFSEAGREQQAARCAVDRGDVYRALNLYEEALTDYERAIAVFARLPSDYDLARAEMGCAAILMLRGKREEAVLALARATAIFRKQKNRLHQAHVRLMQAGMERSAGQTETASREARNAAYTFAGSNLKGWVAEARYILAEIALEEMRPAGVRRMKNVSRTARETFRGWLECRAEHAIGRYYMRRERFAQARTHLRAGIEALEGARTLIAPEEMHISFLRDKLAIYEDLVGLLLTRNRPADIMEALEYVERSRSRLLLERVQAAMGEPSATLPLSAARTRLNTIRAELSRGYYQEHTFGENDRRRLLGNSSGENLSLAPLEAAYQEALREVELHEISETQNAFHFSPLVAVEELQKALQPEETLVEFYVVNGKHCAFLLTQNTVKIQYLEASLEETAYLQRKLRYHLQKIETTEEYRNRHTFHLQSGLQETLLRLYELLLKPLEAMLSEKVVLVPYGNLHGLPFHALFDGTAYALENREFLYAPSAAVWHTGVQRSGQVDARDKSKPDLKKDFPALIMGIPGEGIERVADEVALLGKMLPGAKVFCGEQATTEVFRKYAGQSRLIHLATHARYRADNPLFSGLRFSGGWLLARDLYDMTLNCDMATLSACHTGVASVETGDELFGLVRGFLAAGARSVTASLWAVEDTATATLMVRFYTHLLCGETKAAALRSAQREMLKEYPHPYHWAAFALVGER